MRLTLKSFAAGDGNAAKAFSSSTGRRRRPSRIFSLGSAGILGTTRPGSKAYGARFIAGCGRADLPVRLPADDLFNLANCFGRTLFSGAYAYYAYVLNVDRRSNVDYFPSGDNEH